MGLCILVYICTTIISSFPSLTHLALSDAVNISTEPQQAENQDSQTPLNDWEQDETALECACKLDLMKICYIIFKRERERERERDSRFTGRHNG